MWCNCRTRLFFARLKIQCWWPFHYLRSLTTLQDTAQYLRRCHFWFRIWSLQMSAFRRHENCDTYRAKDFASSSPLLLQQQKQRGRCLSSVITDTSRTCMHSFCSLSASVAGSSIIPAAESPLSSPTARFFFATFKTRRRGSRRSWFERCLAGRRNHSWTSKRFWK